MIGTKEIHEVAAYADTDRLHELAERCLGDRRIELTSPPEAALIMAQVREPVDGEVFNLGEILVMRCEIRLEETPGWGTVLGDDPERSLCAAILDAASRSEISAEIEEELSSLLASIRESRRERWRKVQPTRAEFEEMPS